MFPHTCDGARELSPLPGESEDEGSEESRGGEALEVGVPDCAHTANGLRTEALVAAMRAHMQVSVLSLCPLDSQAK